MMEEREKGGGGALRARAAMACIEAHDFCEGSVDMPACPRDDGVIYSMRCGKKNISYR